MGPLSQATAVSCNSTRVESALRRAQTPEDQGDSPRDKFSSAMVLIAILTVRRDAVELFTTYEHQAAAIMARYGGAIERTVVLASESPDTPHREVHVVTFPSSNAFDAYRADPAVLALKPMRDASILSTEILVGESGPVYGPQTARP